MGRREKLLRRFLSKPWDFTWRELVTLLASFDYKVRRGSKTGGSRGRFIHPERGPICLHKPHSGHLRQYQLEQIIDLLREEGLI